MVFNFLFQKNHILTGNKHCGGRWRCSNASASPVPMKMLIHGIHESWFYKLKRFEKKKNGYQLVIFALCTKQIHTISSEP